MNLRIVFATFAAVATLVSHAFSSPEYSQNEDTRGTCIPASERAGRSFGSFPTRAAAENARGERGTVLESLGKVWLSTIAEPEWRSSGGTHVTEVGPLPTTAGIAYTAQFMEAVFRPGMKSLVHRHSGPEAWYTVSGETCLETPQGKMIDRAVGSHVVVPGGPPMELTATGSEVRRALVLILHDSAQPATSPAADWTPKGLCKG